MRTSEYDHVDNLVNQVPLWPLVTSRAMLHLLSPGGRRACRSILIFHRVLPFQETLFHDEGHRRTFDQKVEQLAASLSVISLGNAIRGLRNGTPPARADCATYDAGYADNAAIALPILDKRDKPVTFFVAPGFL